MLESTAAQRGGAGGGAPAISFVPGSGRSPALNLKIDIVSD